MAVPRELKLIRLDIEYPKARQKKPKCFDHQIDWDAWCYYDAIAIKNDRVNKKRLNGTYKFDPCKDCWKEVQQKKHAEGKCDEPWRKLKTKQEIKDQSKDEELETRKCVTCETVKDIFDFEHIHPKEGRIIIRNECRNCYNGKKRRKNGLTSTDYKARKQDRDVL